MNPDELVEQNTPRWASWLVSAMQQALGTARAGRRNIHIYRKKEREKERAGQWREEREYLACVRLFDLMIQGPWLQAWSILLGISATIKRNADGSVEGMWKYLFTKQFSR